MKLATFRPASEPYAPYRLGVLLEALDEPLVLDLLACQEAGRVGSIQADLDVPSDMLTLLRLGDEGLNAVRHALDLVVGEGSSLAGWSKMVRPVSEIAFGPAVPNPGKTISVGLNFAEHVGEAAALASEAPDLPMAFLKVATSLTGHEMPIVLPRDVPHIDYEVELAVVIGKQGKRISEKKALDHVAGYCVFNDVSARSVQFREMERGLLNLGKNFDTFGPIGPWLVTRDEVEDVQDLPMELRVNGEVRQEGNTSQMVHSVAALVAYWSQMTLEPGDVITSGTPSGVAAFRKPDPAPYYLKPHDLVEAQIGGLGTLRNTVVSE